MRRYLDSTAIALLCIMLVAIPTCTFKKEKRYTFRDDKFSISVPSSWKIIEHSKGTRMLAEIPDDKGISIIKQNVNVVVDESKKPISLQEYVQYQIVGMEKLKGIHIFNSEECLINGVQARWFTYSYTINDFGYKAVVYTLHNESKFFVITGISQLNNFNMYKPIFHDIAKSFTLE